MKTALASFLVAAITVLAPAIAAEPQLSRPQALKRLSDTDAGKRREATARLGDVGVMSDAKALVDELRDPDELVRTHAEEALWKIWGRSGDAKVDALYEKGLALVALKKYPDAVAALDSAFGDHHPNEIGRARWKPAELLGLPQVVANRPVLDDLAVL